MREADRHRSSDRLAQPTPRWEETGNGEWPSWYAVTDLAAASIGAASAEIVALQRSPTSRVAIVDRRLASLWFDWSLRPKGWTLPGPWDAIAGDYKAADGWIKLHTNAPHHRAAALRALDLADNPDLRKEDVAKVVAGLHKEQLERAVVNEGGCAAAMRSSAEWLAHPQGQALGAEPLIHWQPNLLAESSQVRQTGLSAHATNDYPLAGLRVLDLTRVLAGPVASRFLARFGAQVLRIDPPHWEEPGVIPEVTLGKRCAGLDLKQNADRVQFEQLLAGADVLIHGYRPGALDNLGYDSRRLTALNPQLIDVALCAYGWTGPWAQRRGFDSLVQMSCGIAHYGMQQSRTDKPTPLPVQALDHATGYLLAAATVRALRIRHYSGEVINARLSLARTALLLATSQRQTPGTKFEPESAQDLDSFAELTAWGPAQRIRFPATLPDTRQIWQISASDLRCEPAIWSERH